MRWPKWLSGVGTCAHMLSDTNSSVAMWDFMGNRYCQATLSEQYSSSPNGGRRRVPCEPQFLPPARRIELMNREAVRTRLLKTDQREQLQTFRWECQLP